MTLPEILLFLNSPSHDYLDKAIKRYRRDKKAKVIVVEAVLLIESGLHKKMDKIIVVKANKSQQLLRLRQNKKMSAAQAKQRMNFQLKFKDKSKYADHIIDNRHAIKDTEVQVKLLYEIITGK